MYQLSAAHACTISGICSVFTITLILIVQNYLQLVLCVVISIVTIHFCMVSWTLTTSIYLQCSTASFPSVVTCKFRILFKISLLTYKTLHGKQPVYLHSMLAPLLPSRSLRSNEGISLPVLRVKTNTGARAVHCCTLSLWNNLPLSVHSAISVCYLQDTSQGTSLWVGLPP